METLFLTLAMFAVIIGSCWFAMKVIKAIAEFIVGHYFAIMYIEPQNRFAFMEEYQKQLKAKK